MSKNIDQVYIANPITSNASTDLMYFGQSPYGAGNDAAMTYSNFSSQFVSSSILTTKGDIFTFSTVNTRLPVGVTNGMILQVNSAASTGLAWSTATYPVTTTINQILFSSSANVVGGISSANSAVLVSNSTGVPSFSGTMTNGQLIIGSTGATPTASTLTAGTGVSITNGAASITIASNGATPWVDQTTASVTMATNTGYTSDAGASLVTFTLPTTAAIGDWIEINGKGAGGWTLVEGTNQQIHLGNLTTTLTTGSISSSNQWDCVRLRCVTANTIFTVVSGVGNLTIV